LFAWLNIKAKLILVLVLVSLIPLGVVAWYSLDESQESISREVFNHLVSVRDAKHAQILRLYQKSLADIRVLAGSSHINAALDAFSSVVQEGQVDEAQFSYFESLEYGPSFRQFIEEYGYYDLMLVTEQGDIVYSTKRETDFTQNIITGPLKDTLLGRSIKQGFEKVSTTDFQIYAPSNNQVISFLIAPIGWGGGAGGAVVLKTTNKNINEIMLERAGMGETGEAYLVGPDNLMRSDSYLDKKNRTVTASFNNPEKGTVDNGSTKAAFAGKTGRHIIQDYRNELTLSTYLPVSIGPSTYALVAEIDQKEAFRPIARLQNIVVILASVVVALMLVCAYFIANIVTRPILALTHSSIQIADGDLAKEVKVDQNDELGVLAQNFDQMRLSIRHKIDEIELNRAALKQANETLEQRVEERTQELAKTYNVISQSIKYASHIQRSVLPPEDMFKQSFIEHFIIWDPRVVVRADIY